MTTTAPKRTRRKKRSVWRSIIVDVLSAYVGQEVALAVIYEAARQHPDVQQRTSTNRHIEAKVRQQLQVLRDAGWIDSVRRGVWRIRELHR